MESRLFAARQAHSLPSLGREAPEQPSGAALRAVSIPPGGKPLRGYGAAFRYWEAAAANCLLPLMRTEHNSAADARTSGYNEEMGDARCGVGRPCAGHGGRGRRWRCLWDVGRLESKVGN